jgi:hypothetical protein
MDLDYVSYERQDEDVTARTVHSLLPTKVTDPGYDTRYATGARTVANRDRRPTRVIQTTSSSPARVESIDDPTIFLDLRTGLAPTDLVFSHPAFALYFNGDAVFSGEVAADSFTAPTATFANTLQVGTGGPFQSGVIAVWNDSAGDYPLIIRTRDVAGIPAVTSNVESEVFPLWLVSPTVLVTGDHLDLSPVAVEIHGTLTVSGGLPRVAGRARSRGPSPERRRARSAGA